MVFFTIGAESETLSWVANQNEVSGHSLMMRLNRNPVVVMAELNLDSGNGPTPIFMFFQKTGSKIKNSLKFSEACFTVL